MKGSKGHGIILMYKSLEEISIMYPNCKCQIAGNFLDAYSSYLEPLRHEPIKLLEIGVQNGNSLLMWQAFFDEVSIFGLDIELNANVKDATLCCASQTSSEARDALVAQYGENFDVIIEDGGTTQTEKITAFELYFPLLKAGGFYFIDHIQHSYEPKNYGGHLQRHSLVEYLKTLIDAVNLYGRADRGDALKAFAKYEKGDFSFLELNIDFIHFYCGLCVIRRRKNV